MIKVIKIIPKNQYAVPTSVDENGRILTAQPILPDGSLGKTISVVRETIVLVSLLEILWRGILKLFRKRKKDV
jgi:hypothetical protein